MAHVPSVAATHYQSRGIVIPHHRAGGSGGGRPCLRDVSLLTDLHLGRRKARRLGVPRSTLCSTALGGSSSR